MKKIIIAALFFTIFGFIAEASADEKPRIGILRFTNHTHASWWHVTAGQELQDMLIAELASTKAFSVLERKELDAVIAEQKLGASGLVNPKTATKLGNLTGAKYLVAATVSAFEEGTGGKKGGVKMFGVSVGRDKQNAYMAVDLKVIDVETGEIIDTRTVEGSSASSGFRLGVNVMGFSGDYGTKAKTPTGKAIRGCIVEISQYLECSLVEGKDAACMKEYDEKESKRRERTKGAIELE
ncbi:MAG: CsgG/HfaB family protein [Deltaproteobacteria bacterium]|nr:CsgG/HfaB family protein [Deltaproteobacteria bacterium]